MHIHNLQQVYECIYEQLDTHT